MDMPYKQSIERGVATGAYVPAGVLKQQEHQRAKLAKAFKERPVFSETKLEAEVVNKPVAKKLPMPPEDDEASAAVWKAGAYLPASELQRQDHNRVDVSRVVKPATDIQPIFVEEKPHVYSDRVRSYAFTMQLPKTREPRLDVVEALGLAEVVQVFNKRVDIKDCGFKASWVYKCNPWKSYAACVSNVTDGAWVPYIVIYRAEYEECKFIKDTHGREFGHDYGDSHK